MDSSDTSTHEYYMRECIYLAKIAKQCGDSPVGSIIVKGGKILAEGIEAGKLKKTLSSMPRLKRFGMQLTFCIRKTSPDVLCIPLTSPASCARM